MWSSCKSLIHSNNLIDGFICCCSNTCSTNSPHKSIKRVILWSHFLFDELCSERSCNSPKQSTKQCSLATSVD